MVTSLANYQFRYCTNLASITLPPALTSIGEGAFNSCVLASIALPSTLKTIGHFAFNGQKFVTLDLPASVTSIGQSAFANNALLTTVTIHATTPPTNNGYFFNGCSALQAIYVPAGSVDAYKSASGWSSYSSKIQAIP